MNDTNRISLEATRIHFRYFVHYVELVMRGFISKKEDKECYMLTAHIDSIKNLKTRIQSEWEATSTELIVVIKLKDKRNCGRK